MRSWLRKGSWIWAVMAAVALAAAAPPARGQSIAVSVALELLPGVDVTAPLGEGAPPGSTIYYLFRVQNTGTLATSYKLSVTTPNRWNAVLPQHANKQIATLQPGQTEIVPMAVTVPANATVGSTGEVVLAATADEKPRPSDQASVITTVIPSPEIPRTVITPPGQSGTPGTTVIYDFQVKNIGVIDATFQLRVSSSPKWTTTLPAHPKGKVGPLAPGQVETVPVAVEIPASAAVGATCDTTLTAIRLGRPKLEDQGTVTTVVVAPGSLSLALSGPMRGAEGALTYRAVVVNRADRASAVRLSGFCVGGRPVMAAGKETAEITLPAGGTSEVLLTVSGDDVGEADYLVVSAESPDGKPRRVQLTAPIPAS